MSEISGANRRALKEKSKKHKKSKKSKRDQNPSEDEEDDYDEENEYDEADDYSEESKTKGGRKKSKTSKKTTSKGKASSKNLGVRKFLDVEADEDDNDFESDDEEREIKGGKEQQYYKPEELARRNDQTQKFKEIERKAKGGDYDDMAEEEDEDDDDEEYEGQRSRQPSVNDPRLWQVRVKRGAERQTVMSLMNKSIDFARKGKPLAILSATCSENVEGFIYVEAFKEIHVRTAIEGLYSILGGKVSLVELAEMTGIYQNTSETDQRFQDIKLHQWVRIKSGLYAGDLGLVEALPSDNKIWLRVIPRIDLTVRKDQDKKKTFQLIRPPQKQFNVEEAKKIFGSDKISRQPVSYLKNKHFDVYKKHYFRKGFLYKNFTYKQIDIDSVTKPGVEEVQSFIRILKNTSSSGLIKNNDDQNNDTSGDEGVTAEVLIKKTFYQDGSPAEICKEDKIKVIKGDLNGTLGVVTLVEREVGFIRFKATNIPGFEDELRIEYSSVAKYFEPGDHVRIIDGKNAGETGIVIKSETNDKGSFASIILAQSKKEIRIFTNNLKLKSKIEQTGSAQAVGGQAMLSDKLSGTAYKAQEMVAFNQSKNVGIILQVDLQTGTGQDYLRLINDQGTLQTVKSSDINKKFDLREMKSKSTAIDSKGHTIYVDNVVKIVGGQYKGRKGVVKYIYRDVVFLWDREFHQTNGLFVEKTRNLVALGQEQMSSDGASGASMNKRTRDPLLHKDVLITGGYWKGHRGKVCQIDDRQAIIEISSVCRKIPIERTAIQEIHAAQVSGAGNQDNDFNMGGRTVYEAGKTPLQYNTPSYYPHGPQHWGQTPGQGTEYGGNMSPAFSHHGGSQYFPEYGNQRFTPGLKKE